MAYLLAGGIRAPPPIAGAGGMVVDVDMARATCNALHAMLHGNSAIDCHAFQ